MIVRSCIIDFRCNRNFSFINPILKFVSRCYLLSADDMFVWINGFQMTNYFHLHMQLIFALNFWSCFKYQIFFILHFNLMPELNIFAYMISLCSLTSSSCSKKKSRIFVAASFCKLDDQIFTWFQFCKSAKLKCFTYVYFAYNFPFSLYL